MIDQIKLLHKASPLTSKQESLIYEKSLKSIITHSYISNDYISTTQLFCSSNHIAVRVIRDISPELVFIDFEITLSIREGDFEIDKK